MLSIALIGLAIIAKISIWVARKLSIDTEKTFYLLLITTLFVSGLFLFLLHCLSSNIVSASICL